MADESICYLSATELGMRIAAGEVSSTEATEAYLERIARLDGNYASYITVTPERARADARQADAEIAAGNRRGPLHGVPVAVKDQFDTAGIVTTNGSTILAENVPDEDATIMSRLRDAGTVLLGKLNMSEYASGDAFRHPYGRPRNPWDTNRNPGTSSSGSGAATAAFLCATSLGEDTGGSIRGPAAFCGLVGIRPTLGLVSRHGVFGACWSMDTAGPVSRTVTDCANTLAAIAGHDPNDQQTWDVPVPDYAAALDGNVKGLKLGIVTERVHTDANDPEVRDAVLAATQVLAGLGAEVSEVSLPLIVNSSEISYAIISSDAAMLNWDIISTEQLRELDHNNQVRLLMGSVIPSRAYQKAARLRDVLRRQILGALEGVDALIMPASSVPATLIPDSAGLGTKADVITGFKGRRGFTAPFNLANLPALSINCGFTASGLPIGLQIAGRAFDETTLFRLAYAYEQATDWGERRPPGV
ncbi:MAG: amidase [Chloroflexi bacterium]|nr:amidase [Chloroflexota bacterium]MYD48718.1 amidase [Chloroflexota bacterium]